MKTIEVVAAVICKDDKIFATQRGYGEWKDWWEFPGGKMEPRETPEEALKREIREELSTDISVDEFLCTVEYDYPNPSGDALLYVLTVDGLASPERARGSQVARKGGTAKREVATSRCGGNREIAAENGKSERTVKTITIALQEKNILRRVNGKRNGPFNLAL